MARGEADFKDVISSVLRYGVITSFVIVAFGSALLFANPLAGQYQTGSPASVVGQSSFQVGLSPLVQGLAEANPDYVIELGMLILLATPVVRVAVSIPLFFKERRYPFVLITTAVLALLLFSMLVVAPQVGA